MPTKRAKKAAPAASKGPSKEQVRERTLKVLGPLATRINGALEKASVAEGRADDLRLTAAVSLGEAKTAATVGKINFKKWAEENVTQSYETVRKLVRVGLSPDPAQALADLRAGTKASVAKSREKKAISGPAVTFADLEAAMATLPEKKLITLIGSHAGNHGMMLVQEGGSPDERIWTAFLELKTSTKLKLIGRMADEVGAVAEYQGVSLNAETKATKRRSR
jgi:hypothetical protein